MSVVLVTVETTMLNVRKCMVPKCLMVIFLVLVPPNGAKTTSVLIMDPTPATFHLVIIATTTARQLPTKHHHLVIRVMRAVRETVIIKWTVVGSVAISAAWCLPARSAVAGIVGTASRAAAEQQQDVTAANLSTVVIGDGGDNAALLAGHDLDPDTVATDDNARAPRTTAVVVVGPEHAELVGHAASCLTAGRHRDVQTDADIAGHDGIPRLPVVAVVAAAAPSGLVEGSTSGHSVRVPVSTMIAKDTSFTETETSCKQDMRSNERWARERSAKSWNALICTAVAVPVARLL